MTLEEVHSTIEGTIDISSHGNHALNMQDAADKVVGANSLYFHFPLGLSGEVLEALPKLQVGSSKMYSDEVKVEAFSVSSCSAKVMANLKAVGNDGNLSDLIASTFCKVGDDFANVFAQKGLQGGLFIQTQFRIYANGHPNCKDTYSWHLDTYGRHDNVFEMLTTLKGNGTVFCRASELLPCGGYSCKAGEENLDQVNIAGYATLLAVDKSVHSAPIGPCDEGRIFARFRLYNQR